MNKFLLFLVGCLLSFNVLAQTSAPVVTLTVADGDSISSGYLLSGRTIPSSVWCDSLTASTTLSIQVGFNRSRTTEPTVWYDLCEVSDSTVYSVPFADDKITPFDPVILLSVVGSWPSESHQIWFRYVLGASQTNDKYLFTRLRYF